MEIDYNLPFVNHAFHRLNFLTVAAIQAVGQTQQRSQHIHRVTLFNTQCLKTVMLRRRHILAVIPTEIRNDSALSQIETGHI